MTPIVGPPSSTLDAARRWATSRGAAAVFVDEMAPALWAAGLQVGVDPAVLVAQSGKETAFGRFGGVLDASFRNTCGLKTAAGGGNYDPDAHQRFTSWRHGAEAHANHLGHAYAGLPPVGHVAPRTWSTATASWAGTVVHVEELGGRWAPAAGYGHSIVTDYLTGLWEASMATGYYLLDNPNPKAAGPDGAYRFHGYTGRAAAIQVIGVHTAEIAIDVIGTDTSAENIGRYFATTDRAASYHTIVDSDSTVRLIPATGTAFGARGWNSKGVHLSFGCRTIDWGRHPDWDTAALDRAAREAALWCRDHAIPVRRITLAQAQAGEKGFIDHARLDPGRRSDPGSRFDWARFLDLVRVHLDGTPPATEEDDDMKPYLAQGSGPTVYLIFPNGQDEKGVPTGAGLADCQRIYGPEIHKVSDDFLKLHGITP